MLYCLSSSSVTNCMPPLQTAHWSDSLSWPQTDVLIQYFNPQNLKKISPELRLNLHTLHIDCLSHLEKIMIRALCILKTDKMCRYFKYNHCDCWHPPPSLPPSFQLALGGKCFKYTFGTCLICLAHAISVIVI